MKNWLRLLRTFLPGLLIAMAFSWVNPSSSLAQEAVSQHSGAVAEASQVETLPKDAEQSEQIPAVTDSQPEQSYNVLTRLELKGDFAQTAALYGLLVEADEETLKQYLEDTALIPSPSDRAGPRHVIYLRFSELAPEAALAYILERSPSSNRYLDAVFVNWAKYYPIEAIKRAESLATLEHRQIASSAILRANDTVNVAALKALATQLPENANLESTLLTWSSPKLRQTRLMQSIRHWGSKDKTNVNQHFTPFPAGWPRIVSIGLSLFPRR